MYLRLCCWALCNTGEENHNNKQEGSSLKRRRDIFTGPPGAGKGTSGKEYAKRVGAQVIESSAVLRMEVDRGTPLGHDIKYCMSNSLMVPDEDMIKVIQNFHTIFSDPQRLLLDGFLRTIPQIKFMFGEQILCPTTDDLVHVHIHPSDKECKRRMHMRGRLEDPNQRMEDYWKHSHPAVIQLYDLIDKRVKIEGDFSREFVTNQLIASIPAA